MSHVATVDIEVRDLGALHDACNRLGLELVKNQTSYRWYGRSVGDSPLPPGFTAEDLGKCAHAIRIPNNVHAYEVGVVARRDGKPGFLLQWDSWCGGRGLVDHVGDNCTKLIQQYGICAGRREAMRRGFRIEEERTLKDGTMQLVLAR